MSEPLGALQTRWRSRLRRGGREAWQAALGLLYPPTCIACQAATGEPHALCAECWSQIRFIERPFCERLGTPFAVDLGQPLLSPAAIADPPVFQRARAVAEYDGTASLLVHRLKYNDRLELARALGRHDDPGRRGAAAGFRRDRAGAPASLAALVAALQPGDGAGRGGRHGERRALRSLSCSPASSAPAARSG